MNNLSSNRTRTVLMMLLALLPLFALASCNSKKQQPRHSTEAERVLALLDSTGKAGRYLFGHQDDLFYGHHWSFKDADVTDSSDTKAVCGEYPGIIGAEIGAIELGQTFSLDSVPFDLIRRKAVEQFERGGLITVSWHPYSPVSDSNAWYLKDTNVVSRILHDSTVNAKFRGYLGTVADFFGSIKTADGKLVPIIFRPWHEMNYSWFWWGKKFCADSEYVALYRMTVDFMREKGLNNLLFAYSPSQQFLPEDYSGRYPGDDYVDILGCDDYMYGSREEFAAMVQTEFSFIRQMAAEHHKPFALTETGSESMPDPEWWTKTLAPAVRGTGISYLLTWRNAWNRPTHYFSTFAGEHSAPDFVEFYKLPETVFAGDLK